MSPEGFLPSDETEANLVISYSAIEHYPSVVPDVMVFAKGVANGFPLSGIVSRKELMDKQPVSHFLSRTQVAIRR